MKWTAVVIILIGIGILSYPFFNDQYASYKKNQLIEQFEAGEVSVAALPEAEDDLQDVSQLLEEGETGDFFFANDEKETNLVGKIEIPRIQLELPVLQGANVANLKYGVGHMNGTAVIGHNGNAALAAHRGYSDGKLFNRLDEVQQGDMVVINTTEGKYEYRVKDSFLVTPDDLSVLEQTEGEAMLTLITCDPVPDPTHRLIVKATLVE
ncbi:class D sortase [Halobacillus litoralis]|uniref:class D sortase n=1 Tax=Halobacillus litoralis TaxID=45668 RepID=UPI00249174CD|nr:class D sortase [Halobacillus litoralis]